MSDRKIDAVEELAGLAVDTQHRRAAPDSEPHVAIGIDAESVGHGAVLREFAQGSTVADLVSGCVVVENRQVVRQ